MDRGYLRLWRCTRESWIVKDHASFILFFGYLLPKAAWKPMTQVIDGREIFLHPGDVVFGRKRASDATGLSEKCVRNALERLTRRASIRASQRASTYTIYSIVNWAIYQGEELDEGQLMGHPNAHSGASTRASTGASQGPAQGPQEKNLELEEVKRESFGPTALFELWNDRADLKLRRVTQHTEERKRKARLRLKEHPDREFWVACINRLNASAFCLGENDRGWVASFDFIIQPKSLAKLVEGCYDNRTRPTALPFCGDPHGGLKKVVAEDRRD